MRIPSDLIAHYGKKTINKSTRTDSYKEAEKQLKAQLYEFDLVRAKVSDNGKEAYEQHLAYLMSIIEASKHDGSKNILDAPEFNADATMPEPMVKAVNDAIAYYYDDSLKNAKHHKDTYAITLREALKLEEERIERREKDTGLVRKRATAVKLFLQHIGVDDMSLQDISKRMANIFVDAMVDAEKSHKTIKNYIAGLRACWEAAARFEHVDHDTNPFFGIKVEAQQSKSYEPFKREQLEALLVETSSSDHDFHHVFRIGLVTGARLLEIVSLEKDDILEIDGVTCMQIKDGKTANSVRIVPLHGSVGDKVRELAAKCEKHLFPKLIAMKPSSVSNLFAKVKKEAGISEKGYVFHSLRHNMATALERSAIPEHQINRILGHKITNMSTGIYSKGLPLTEMAKQIGAALEQPDYPKMLYY